MLYIIRKSREKKSRKGKYDLETHAKKPKVLDKTKKKKDARHKRDIRFLFLRLFFRSHNRKGRDGRGEAGGRATNGTKPCDIFHSYTTDNTILHNFLPIEYRTRQIHKDHQ